MVTQLNTIQEIPLIYTKTALDLDITLIECDVCNDTFEYQQHTQVNGETQVIQLFPPVSTLIISSPYGSKFDSPKRGDYHICDKCMAKTKVLTKLINLS